MVTHIATIQIATAIAYVTVSYFAFLRLNSSRCDAAPTRDVLVLFTGKEFCVICFARCAMAGAFCACNGLRCVTKNARNAGTLRASVE